MDWNKLMEQYPLHQNDGGGGGNSNGGGGGGDGLYVKVMTDEQMEVLRRQISVYATICEQLVEMHKSFTTAQHDLTGIRMGNPYCDPSIVYAGNSISARHRWTPTAVQLQLLERIFEEGSGTPSKEKIKDITSKLSKHGQISETNVYNWFQNRRARSKRKPWVGSPNNAEPEVGMAKEKKMKQECSRSHEEESTQRVENVDTQNPETSSKMPCLDTQTSTPNFKSSASLGSLAWNSSTTNG